MEPSPGRYSIDEPRIAVQTSPNIDREGKSAMGGVEEMKWKESKFHQYVPPGSRMKMAFARTWADDSGTVYIPHHAKIRRIELGYSSAIGLEVTINATYYAIGWLR